MTSIPAGPGSASKTHARIDGGSNGPVPVSATLDGLLLVQR